MEQIKMVIMDMAGTTVTDHGEIEDCFLEACLKTGLNPSREEINAMMGFSKIEVFRTFWTQRLGKVDEVELKAQESYVIFKNLLEDWYETQPITPTVGAVETIKNLRDRGVRVVLNTGFYRAVTDIILKRLGWDAGLNDQKIGGPSAFIDMSIASDEVPKGRPASYMILRAMNTFGISDSKLVVKIGDTPVDIEEGLQAKCLLSLALTNGSHSESELMGLGAHALLPSMHELIPFLESKRLI